MLTSVLPSKESAQMGRLMPASVGRDVGVEGVCLPDAHVKAKPLCLQLEPESAILRTFHAYVVPATGLPGLRTVFTGYGFAPYNAPVLISELGSMFPAPTAQVLAVRTFILHGCFPFNGKENGL